MLTDAIKYIQSLAVSGKELDPEIYSPVLVSKDVSLKTLEQYNMNRYRERYNMRTASIDSFIDYTNKRAGEFSITSVDPDTASACAIFNSKDKHGAGHCDDTAECVLKPLPIYKFLMGIGENDQLSCKQRDVIDIIRDWHDYMPDSVALVAGFTKLTVEGVSNASSTERDFGVEKSAMEKIDVKSEGGEVPHEIAVKVVPYEGFVERNVVIGVSALVNRDRSNIELRLRVRGYESLKLSIADEFAKKLASELDAAPVIGTVKPAA